MLLLLSTLPGAIERLAATLRFPQLFLLTGGLFILDLVIPDLIPFVDEILLGLLTLLLGMWQKQSPTEPPREIKDVTPKDDRTPGA